MSYFEESSDYGAGTSPAAAVLGLESPRASIRLNRGLSTTVAFKVFVTVPLARLVASDRSLPVFIYGWFFSLIVCKSSGLRLGSDMN